MVLIRLSAWCDVFSLMFNFELLNSELFDPELFDSELCNSCCSLSTDFAIIFDLSAVSSILNELSKYDWSTLTLKAASLTQAFSVSFSCWYSLTFWQTVSVSHSWQSRSHVFSLPDNFIQLDSVRFHEMTLRDEDRQFDWFIDVMRFLIEGILMKWLQELKIDSLTDLLKMCSNLISHDSDLNLIEWYVFAWGSEGGILMKWLWELKIDSLTDLLTENVFKCSSASQALLQDISEISA